MELELAKLGRFIADHFDPDQLGVLCRDVGVSYNQLVGFTVSAKAFDLVTLARDRGQLSTLLASVARAYPDVFDPKSMVARHQRRRLVHRRWVWMAVLAAGALFALFGALFFSRAARSAATPEPGLVAVATSTLAPATTTPTPPTPTASSTPTALPNSPTPADIAPTPADSVPTPTSRPTSLPLPSATESPSVTPVPTSRPTDMAILAVTASPASETTSLPSPTPSPTPVLSQNTPALVYDTENRTLTMVPGDTVLRRARLCTPLHPYFSIQAVYFIDDQVRSLGLSLPAKVRITHSFPERLGDEIRVINLDARPHPIEGYKITGEAANMIGCDLTLNQVVRARLGFPLELGEFDDDPRFDHGWVKIEFLDAP